MEGRKGIKIGTIVGQKRDCPDQQGRIQEMLGDRALKAKSIGVRGSDIQGFKAV